MRPGSYIFLLGLFVGVGASSFFWHQKSEREAEEMRRWEAAQWAPMLGQCKLDLRICKERRE